MGICRTLCHSFNFVNMRFVKIIFFPVIYLHGKFITEFYFFLFSYMFSWMNKFLFTENMFLPRIIKQESCRCIFQGVYALNTGSIKILQKGVVKVLITLLIKQYFYATY